MKSIKEDLELLKAANRRLDQALDGTIVAWPYTQRCWVDAINGLPSEPTAMLQKYAIVPRISK